MQIKNDGGTMTRKRQFLLILSSGYPVGAMKTFQFWKYFRHLNDDVRTLSQTYSYQLLKILRFLELIDYRYTCRRIPPSLPPKKYFSYLSSLETILSLFSVQMYGTYVRTLSPGVVFLAAVSLTKEDIIPTYLRTSKNVRNDPWGLVVFCFAVSTSFQG